MDEQRAEGRQLLWRLAKYAAVIATLAGLGMMGLVAHALMQHNQYRVGRLRIGITRSQVQEALGRPPDCAGRLRQATVLYFLDPAWGDTFPCGPGATEYATPEQLPAPYSTIMVVLNRQGRVSAFAHVGEGPLQTRRQHEDRPTIQRIPLKELEE